MNQFRNIDEFVNAVCVNVKKNMPNTDDIKMQQFKDYFMDIAIFECIGTAHSESIVSAYKDDITDNLYSALKISLSET